MQVVGTQIARAKLRDGMKRDVEMAQLQGFTASDWGRPLDDLLAEANALKCRHRLQSTAQLGKLEI